MHFHLINFQVIKQYSLKIIDAGCTLYELDYFRESNLTQFQITDNTQLCNYLNALTLNEINPVFDQFNDYYL
jgi:hypothetical protein